MVCTAITLFFTNELFMLSFIHKNIDAIPVMIAVCMC